MRQRRIQMERVHIHSLEAFRHLRMHEILAENVEGHVWHAMVARGGLAKVLSK